MHFNAPKTTQLKLEFNDNGIEWRHSVYVQLTHPPSTWRNIDGQSDLEY